MGKVTFGLDYLKRADGVLVLRRATWHYAARLAARTRNELNVTDNANQVDAGTSNCARRKQGKPGGVAV